MSQLHPEVRDITSLGPVFAQDQYLDIGVEGHAGVTGTATAGTSYTIARAGDAETYFGIGSSLTLLVKFLLEHGVAFVKVVPSVVSASAPNLAQRQAAWTALEEDRDVRIRLTDSEVQADLVALADSCEQAELIQNKQFCFVGMATGTTKAAFLTAATAIVSKRGVLVAPSIYDQGGVLKSGKYAAAWVAAEVAKNPDIADDLDTALIPGSTGIEKATNGLPLFRQRANAGAPINDFEDLLIGGVSPLRQGRRGGAEIDHLRTTYVADGTYDALMTRLIADQLFIDIRTTAEESLYLRKPNTDSNRRDLGAVIERLLAERSNWVRPKVQPDGNIGYGVSVTPTADGRGIVIHYSGTVVRNIQTIDVSGTLTIPA